MVPRALFALLLAALWLATAPDYANTSQEWVEGTGVVVGVIDRDTIDVLITAEVAMSLGFPRRKNPISLRLRIDQNGTSLRCSSAISG